LRLSAHCRAPFGWQNLKLFLRSKRPPRLCDISHAQQMGRRRSARKRSAVPPCRKQAAQALL